MTFDFSRVSDPLYFSENRREAHSDHRWFASYEEACLGTSSFEQCLNGTWKFRYVRNPSEVSEGWQKSDADCSTWDDIRVPAHIQMEGYDLPQYANVQYPWDGHESIEPGQIPTKFNPVGLYVRDVVLDNPVGANERLSIAFKGAESAVALWINGTYVGYGADSFTPSEFDITEFVHQGKNRVAAQVIKWTSGSWIEDQDFYRFSGLFRDVVLYRRPAVHAEHVIVRTELTPDMDRATISIDTSLVGDGYVRARVVAVGECEGEPATVSLSAPRLWSAEDPYLYEAELEVYDSEGILTEFVPLKVGVRRFGIEDGVLKINGQRIVFKGVNRHEFGLQGRVMSRERTEEDVKLLKAAGLNAIRTSHYPNNTFLYELCDEYGLYVIDEMNLESHGLWDRIRYQNAGVETAVPGDRPEWLPVLLDRAASMLRRDRNHPSIVMWSCGNESFGGADILAVSDYFRAEDNRPVHYEGVDWDPRYPQTTDVKSRMYTPAAEVEEYLTTHRDKPFILCEYAHAMGNSFGAVHKYIDLAYREPLFQGGFIWDFADQAIALTDRYGEHYFGYGGDCGEAPHDAEFCGNGILFADHTPTPRMQEVAHVYRALVTTIERETISIENRFLFTPSNAYTCVVTLRREGRTIKEYGLATAVPPGQTGTYPNPVRVPDTPGEYTVDVEFRLAEPTAWAAAGHRIAGDQAVFTNPANAAVAAARGSAPTVVNAIHNIGVHGEHFSALFSKLHGGLVSYRYGQTQRGGRELLRSMPLPNFWHAPTSNERGWKGPSRDAQWLGASRYCVPLASLENPTLEVNDDVVVVTFTYVLPTTPQSTSTVSYAVDGQGRIEVTTRIAPGAGLPDMPEFSLMMAVDADLHNLRYYGEGPEECYVDRREGARLDVFERDVATMLTPYLRPQEAGNRTGVRWAEITDERGHGIRLDCAGTAGGMELSALPWTPFEVENALHPNELPRTHRTILRPAYMRRGVGGDDTWGAMTLPEYRLPADKELSFTFAFQGIL
ncbi:glycoside hydrolase family 2 TIM barrel-domain containing protein [Changpingibacter yushuensis]|uniref:glycoside hydrolase family 2 TIM barrel-domain containing protein n=1 Tax=Changpingibacter yushuensis TaxID=2758440 RepID=UPI0015F4BF60|nr:glycoside hydrolase family 2 TIM barrel-domain containing protein [Changpingibacter yushuensis]